MIAAGASLLAALLYAAASVLQHRAAMSVPADRSLRPGLLGVLATKPWWLAGVAADGLGFVMQFIALGHGPLVIVQPLLVCGLLFALPFGALLSHGRIHAGELSAGAAVVAGLAALLLSANPARGRSDVSDSVWLILAVATAVPVAVLVVAALRWPAAKAGLLASAAAVLYGLSAALAKTSAHLLGRGIGPLLTSWQLYALVAAGAVGMLLCQSAFQAGPLRASLPLLTVVDPVVSIAIGAFAFREHIAQHPAQIVVEVLGAAVMVVGVTLLSRSPLIELVDASVEVSA